jgi:hypothetical protein
MPATKTIFETLTKRASRAAKLAGTARAGADGLGNRISGAQRRDGAHARLGYQHRSSLQRVVFSTTRTEVMTFGELLSLCAGRVLDPRRALFLPGRCFSFHKFWRRRGRKPIRDGARCE